MENCERCIVCTCDENEVKLKQHFHYENNYVFFRTKKHGFYMCDNCVGYCEQHYGKNYCPFCRNKKLLPLSTSNTNTNIYLTDTVVSYGPEADFITSVLSQNIFIKKISDNILADNEYFRELTKIRLLFHIMFSMWFAYFIMLPSCCTLFFCVITNIKNKFIVQFLITLTMFLMHCFAFSVVYYIIL